MFRKTVIALAAFAGLSACANPVYYETAPVLAESPMGPVTCQIYTHEQVSWDRSIARPEAMDVKVADDICRDEGQLVLEGKEPVYAPTIEAPAAGAL